MLRGGGWGRGGVGTMPFPTPQRIMVLSLLQGKAKALSNFMDDRQGHPRTEQLHLPYPLTHVVLMSQSSGPCPAPSPRKTGQSEDSVLKGPRNTQDRTRNQTLTFQLVGFPMRQGWWHCLKIPEHINDALYLYSIPIIKANSHKNDAIYIDLYHIHNSKCT